jgi:hypothetical protein
LRESGYEQPPGVGIRKNTAVFMISNFPKRRGVGKYIHLCGKGTIMAGLPLAFNIVFGSA